MPNSELNFHLDHNNDKEFADAHTDTAAGLYSRSQQNQSYDLSNPEENVNELNSKQSRLQQLFSFSWYNHPILSHYLVLLTQYILFLYLIWAVHHLKAFECVGEALGTIRENYIAKPWMDITMVSKEGACPQDYELASLGTWPRTKNQCFCPHENTEYPRMCTLYERWIEKCYSVDFKISKPSFSFGLLHAHYSSDAGVNKSNDKNPSSTSSKHSISYWKSHKICYKPSQTFIQNLTCSEGYKQCYVGGCFLESEGCPVTNMLIARTWEYSEYTQMMSTNQDLELKVNQANEYFMILERSEGQMPVIGMDYTIVHEDEEIGDVSHYDDSGFAVTHSISTVIDTEKSGRLYYDNNLGEKIQHAPGYEDFAVEHQFLLEQQTKLSINPNETCFNINANDLNNAKQAFSTSNMSSSMLLFCFFYLSVAMFFIILYDEIEYQLDFWLTFFCFKAKSETEEDYYQVHQRILRNGFMDDSSSFFVCLVLLQVAVVSMFLNKELKWKWVIDQMVNGQCFNYAELGYNLHSNYYEALDQFYSFIWNSAALTVFLIIFMMRFYKSVAKIPLKSAEY